MTFDPNNVASYYDELGESEIERWNKGVYARLQKALYCWHLRRRVRPGDVVLDAGCGPGTFTRELLAIGAEVICLDISPAQLQLCAKNAPLAADYVVGSITDLSSFHDSQFDVTIALGGPLSYCFDQARIAARELVRVTRPGGTVGASVMNLYGTIHRILPTLLDVAPATSRQLLDTGDMPERMPTTDGGTSAFSNAPIGHRLHLFRLEEFRALLDDSGLLDIEVSAAGWITAIHELDIADSPECWEQLLEIELEAGAESPGAGTSMLAWGTVPLRLPQPSLK